MVLIMVSPSCCFCSQFQFVTDISPDTLPEPEDDDQEGDSEEHLPPGDIRSKVVADHHIENAADEGAVKVPGSADESREDHFHVPRGINETGGNISVIEDGQRPCKGRNGSGEDEGNPFVNKGIVSQEFHPGFILLDGFDEQSERRCGEFLQEIIGEEKAGKGKAEDNRLLYEVHKTDLCECRGHAVLSAGIFGERHKDKEIPYLIECEIDKGEACSCRPHDDRSKDKPYKSPCENPGRDCEKGILGDVLGEKGDSIGACSQIEHVAEGEPSHVPVKEIKTEDVDTKNNEIRRTVYSNDSGQQKKGGHDHRKFKECSSGPLLHSFAFSLFHCFSRIPSPPRPAEQDGVGRFFVPLISGSSGTPDGSSQHRSWGRYTSLHSLVLPGCPCRCSHR